MSVEPQKNEFTIRTGQGKVAVCYLDEKTVVRRDGNGIKLSDVHAGVRAYCHCSAMNEGKHYSEQLVVRNNKR